MAERFSPYLNRLQRDETRKLLRSLIPEVFLSYRMRRRYRKAFPGAFVSVRASVDPEAAVESGCIVRAGCTLSRTVAIGRYSTLGDNCLLRGKGRIEIGPFCSIGPEVVMLSENHASDRLTTYPFSLYNGIDDKLEFVPDDIVVEADVWIGQRVVVLAGARIGTGCVIGAGSVVPKGTYAPYSVLTGMPARPIKKRLDEKTRHTLIKSEWWLAPSNRIFGDWAVELQKSRLNDLDCFGPL